MIFPLLRGLLWFHRSPMTWIMLAINIAVFAGTFPAYQASDEAIEEIIDDDSFIATNGLLFAATTDVSREPASVRELAVRSLEGSDDAKLLLGHLALRRPAFMSITRSQISNSTVDHLGDLVAIEKWTKTAKRLLDIQRVHPSYQLGLRAGHTEIWRWFTYQAAHSGFVHLFWNMIFLMIFGTFVEHSRGSRAMAVTLWGSGLAGAGFYVLISGLSASPLVGASAAVSGLITLSASNFSRRLPFVYWLLPFRGYYGVAWLPAWVLIPAFVLPDLSGWLSVQPGLSAVAYTAHVGGALFGFAMARVFKEKPEAFVELAQGATGVIAVKTAV